MLVYVVGKALKRLVCDTLWHQHIWSQLAAPESLHGEAFLVDLSAVLLPSGVGGTAHAHSGHATGGLPCERAQQVSSQAQSRSCRAQGSI